MHVRRTRIVLFDRPHFTRYVSAIGGTLYKSSRHENGRNITSAENVTECPSVCLVSVVQAPNRGGTGSGTVIVDRWVIASQKRKYDIRSFTTLITGLGPIATYSFPAGKRNYLSARVNNYAEHYPPTETRFFHAYHAFAD